MAASPSRPLFVNNGELGRRGIQAYSDTKLHDVMLAFAIARRWPDTFSNGLEPGWVATKMGGAHAPDDLAEAYRTQVWLAVSSNAAAEVTGQYFYHRKLREPNPAARDTTKQDKLIAACADFSGVKLPE
jgi:NAD(P)-dependent dehydrogenase (short-subunit alcohol dehydrogenase family)